MTSTDDAVALGCLMPRNCPVCGSSDETHVFSPANYDLAKLDEYAFASRKMPEYMHYRLIHCPTCDLLYASPVPESNTLAQAYEEAAFDSGEEAACAAKTYGSLLCRVLEGLPHRDAVVDVGAGDGAFLHELAWAGFREVIGVEPSAAPIRCASTEVRPWIRHAIFREDGFSRESLSLITCFQTLEHLPDPAELCRSASRLLKPGGAVLFVDHNYRGIANRLMGMRSPIIDIEHLQLFSPHSMSYMLRHCGFVNITVRSICNAYPLHYWLKLMPLPISVKKMLTNVTRRLGIGHLRVAFPAGNMVAYAYKPR
jgi:SAM-dependent methyltransferase